MATRQVLAELAAGVPATQRHARSRSSRSAASMPPSACRPASAFDVVVLASRCDRQADRGGSRGRRAARSTSCARGVAIAVRAGAPRPDIASATMPCAKRVLAARHDRLFDRAERRAPGTSCSSAGASRKRSSSRIVQAPPGVPVGALVARGEVELGFQQLSELMHLDGIDVLGHAARQRSRSSPLSRPGVCAARTSPAAVRALLDFMSLARGRRGQAAPRHGAGLDAAILRRQPA